MRKEKLDKILNLGNVLILGFGVSGKSALRLISNAKNYINIYICEQNQSSVDKNDITWLESLKISLFDEKETLAAIDSYNINTLIVSPGIHLDHPVIIKCREKNIKVLGELEFASTLLEGNLIGITGTNGKTTTVHLLHDIFKNAGKKSMMSGNMGTAVSEVASDYDDIDYHVIEISSYQLELSELLKLDCAIVTNITPDHCNRYISFEEYAKYKLIIESRLKHNGFFVCQIEDLPLYRKLCAINRYKHNWYPVGDRLNKKIPFYADMHGIWFNKNASWELVLERNKIKLRGEHMYKNAAMAATVAYLNGIELESILNTISIFIGLPHRVEWAGEKNGVNFYNDSKATNIDAVLKALDTFCEPVILILGGRDKGADLSLLKDKVSKKVKTAVLIGESSDYYEKFFCGCTKLIRSSDMQDAVLKSYKNAQQGDVILLSPACASFDMYRNFEERGDAFKKAVLHLFDNDK